MMYKTLTDEFLRNSTEWDLIKLETKLDVSQLQDWYYSFINTFSHLRFDTSMTEYIDPKKVSIFMENIQSGNNLSSYTLGWPCDRDVPLPPISMGNTDLFPELIGQLSYKDFKILEKFNTGYIKIIHDMLGDDVCTLLRLSIHGKNSSIGDHTDGPSSIKIHIPILTNEHAYFYFGKDIKQSYVLEPGYMYIVNAHITHSTNNLGNSDRVHLYMEPTNLNQLLKEY